MTNDFKSVINEEERNFYAAMHDLVKAVDSGEFWPKKPAASDGRVDSGAHPEDFCHECHQPNIVWHVASPIWNLVMRRGDAPEPILCPVCFAKRALKHGIESWELRPDPLLYPEIHDQQKTSPRAAVAPEREGSEL